MMKTVFLLATMFILAFTGNPALAQRSDSIAAVVNGDIITYTELYDRMQLIMKSSGMPDTTETRERLTPQILTGLITEQIQLQEAERQNITVGEEEVEDGFANLAAQNNLEPQQFRQILQAQDIAMDTMEQQIKSQIAWSKVIQQELRPRVVLTQSDIDAEIDRLKAREGQEEYFLSEIFLPLREDADETEAKQAAQELSAQLGRDPQEFGAAARQFSQSATAATGGVIGWVTPDQMSEDVASALLAMETGEVSNPIREEDGYTIIHLRDKRTINLGDGSDEETLRIKAAVFDLPEDEREQKAVRDDVQTFRDNVKGCLDIMQRVSRRNNASLRELDDLKSALPTNMVNAVADVNIGEVGNTIETDNAVMVPMLCGREGGAGNARLQREVENRIGTQRLDVLQKRYLRDLITDAYIERRV